MIERALRLRDEVDAFCMMALREKDKNRRLDQEDQLGPEDWEILTAVKTILEPLQRLTKAFEGRNPRFAEVIPTACWLLDDLRERRLQFDERLAFMLFDSPDIPALDRGDGVAAGSSITVGGAPLPNFTMATTSTAMTATPATATRPGTSSGRPQRARTLPRRFDGHEVDLPGHTPGQVLPPDITLLGPEDGPVGAETSEFELGDEGMRYIQKSLDFAIVKLAKYIDLMEENPVYWAALILHPAYKTKWLTEYLEPDRAARIETEFKAFYQQEYGSVDVELPSQPAQSPAQSPGQSSAQLAAQLLAEQRRLAQEGSQRTAWTNRLVPHRHTFYARRPDPATKDELQAYLSEEPEEIDDAVEWWLSPGRRSDFPRLSIMALDLLTIPAMSSECERVFSRAKHTVGHQRHRLDDDAINIVESLKQWSRLR
jgi:hypothetical protein